MWQLSSPGIGIWEAISCWHIKVFKLVWSQQELTPGSFGNGARGYQPSSRAADHTASQLPSIHICFAEQGGNMATTMSWGFSDFRHLFCFTLSINEACMYHNHIPLLYIFSSHANECLFSFSFKRNDNVRSRFRLRLHHRYLHSQRRFLFISKLLQQALQRFLLSSFKEIRHKVEIPSKSHIGWSFLWS